VFKVTRAQTGRQLGGGKPGATYGNTPAAGNILGNTDQENEIAPDGGSDLKALAD
jgi:hypothetical protein